MSAGDILIGGMCRHTAETEITEGPGLCIIFI